MALYIKDDSVADLANKAVKLLGVPNKTEAVRVALTAAILAAKANTPLIERIEAARALANGADGSQHAVHQRVGRRRQRQQQGQRNPDEALRALRRPRHLPAWAAEQRGKPRSTGAAAGRATA